LRVPGIGVKSAQKIIMARKHRRLNTLHLKKLGIAMKRAKYFITCNELPATTTDWEPKRLKHKLLCDMNSKNKKATDTQLCLFMDFKPALPPLH